MGLTFVGALSASIITAVVATVFRAEFEGGAPWLAERLRRLAVRGLKGELRERLDEEWLAVLEEMPTPLSKLWAGVGFAVATRRIITENFLNIAQSYLWVQVSEFNRKIASKIGNPVNHKLENRNLLGATPRDFALARLSTRFHVYKLMALEQAVGHLTLAGVADAETCAAADRLRYLRAKAAARIGEWSRLEKSILNLSSRVAEARRTLAPTQLAILEEAIRSSYPEDASDL